MKQELQEKLFKKYPKIFAQKDLGPKQTAMCWGIECGDGWFWLLDNLCESLQSFIDNNGSEQIVCRQIKEKFGELRFYSNGQNKILFGYISFAGRLSQSICETCGTTENVIQTEGGWVQTICQKCLSKGK